MIYNLSEQDVGSSKYRVLKVGNEKYNILKKFSVVCCDKVKNQCQTTCGPFLLNLHQGHPGSPSRLGSSVQDALDYFLEGFN